MEKRNKGVSLFSVLQCPLLLVCFIAGPVHGADQPTPVGENVAGAKGLDQALQKLHAPLRETDPLSPADELKAFAPRAGLAVDLIAAEPAIRQPLYMTFDERGRMWVVQYIQYPFPAGLKVVEYDQYIRAKFDKVPPAPPKQFRGSDFISILEDTDGDGTFDKQKTFVDGLSICTAALPGRAGVWVLNPPYLLFYPDKNRDDVPDGDPIVHLSGFGLEDTHAVASSLMWGPDGWIYGAHGSTCTSKVKVEVAGDKSEIPNSKSEISDLKSQTSATTDFLGQCIWRYHPDRHVFEIFAEGGGNTFGVAFDDAGHVFSGTNWGNFRGLHYVQGGYFVKGWGKHGPLTNPFAFGFFDHMPHTGNADRLTHTFDIYGGGLLGKEFEGKIIGPSPLQSRVQVTALEPSGSSFKTIEKPFLLTSADGWFRPVDLKTGPDGAIYLADFYEKRISHVDPRDNWHRDSGRLWRVRPGDWKPGYNPFDLASSSSTELVKLLDNPNRWYRATARRLLGDRKDASVIDTLRNTVTTAGGRHAVEALWALNEVGGFDDAIAQTTLDHTNPVVRMWTVRLIGDLKDRVILDATFQKLLTLADRESDPQVRSQLSSTAKRMDGAQAIPLLARLLKRDGDAADPHIPLLLWWAMENKAVSHRDLVLSTFANPDAWKQSLMRNVILQRLAHRYAADATPENQHALESLFDAAPGDPERNILIAGVNEAFEGGKSILFSPKLAAILAKSGNVEIALRAGETQTHERILNEIQNEDPAMKAQRIRYLEILGQVGHPEAVPVLLKIAKTSQWHSVRKSALAALSHFDDPEIGRQIVSIYASLPGDQDVRPAAIATLVSRPAWATSLLNGIAGELIPKSALAADQISMLRRLEDKDVSALTDKIFGKELKPSSEETQKAFARVKTIVLASPGDPAEGKKLFTARCAVCHTLFGEGGKVGPDLTGYERTNVDYMVLNVVDPSASIREEFQTFLIRTKAGQTLSGIVVERGFNQITLVDATGRRTIIPKADIKLERALPTSTMPQGLLDDLGEKQVQDLFTYTASKPAK